MSEQTQLEILKEATELLRKLAEESADRFSAVSERDIRQSFINRHAWNVHDIACDVLVLGEHGDLRSIYLLSRPALESHFKLAAAVANRDFAAQKIVAEVQEEREKVKNWSESQPAWESVLKQIEDGLSSFETELKKRYSVSGENRWKIYKVANEGKMKGMYVSDYFTGSKHVHGMLSALVDREDALYISAAIFSLTMTVAQSAALLSKALADLAAFYTPEVLGCAVDIMKRAKASCEEKPTK